MSKYSQKDVEGFVNRVNHPIPAEGDTVAQEDYPPLAPAAPSTPIAYPATPFGDMATTDALDDLNKSGE